MTPSTAWLAFRVLRFGFWLAAVAVLLPSSPATARTT